MPLAYMQTLRTGVSAVNCGVKKIRRISGGAVLYGKAGGAVLLLVTGRQAVQCYYWWREGRWDGNNWKFRLYFREFFTHFSKNYKLAINLLLTVLVIEFVISWRESIYDAENWLPVQNGVSCIFSCCLPLSHPIVNQISTCCLTNRRCFLLLLDVFVNYLGPATCQSASFKLHSCLICVNLITII